MAFSCIMLIIMEIPKVILVTGGTGYIGSACASLLIKRKYVVVVLSPTTKPEIEKKLVGAIFEYGNILDEAALEAVFSKYSFDAVLHLASKKVVGESNLNPEQYFKVNVSGTINVLSAMSRHRVPTIIFSSSLAVYAPAESEENAFFSELSPVSPASVYASTKLIGESIIQEFARVKKIERYIILRYFNVAGDVGLKYREERPQGLFAYLVNSAKTGAVFSMFGDNYPTRDGTCVRDYVHIADVADAHLAALSSGVSGIFNIGSGLGSSMKEIITEFEGVIGKKLLITIKDRRSGDPAAVLSITEKANKILAWRAVRTLKDIVQSTLDAYGVDTSGKI